MQACITPDRVRISLSPLSELDLWTLWQPASNVRAARFPFFCGSCKQKIGRRESRRFYDRQQPECDTLGRK